MAGYAVRVIALPQGNGIISGGNHRATVRKAGIPWNLPTGERIMVRNVRCCARCAKRAATSCNAKDIRSGRATGTK